MLHRRRRRASSAATSPTRCWPTSGRERRHALRQLLLRAASGTTPHHAGDDAADASCAATSNDLDALDRRDGGPRPGHPPRLEPRHRARAMTDPTIDFDEGTLLTHHVVEAMRRDRRAARSLYASGSGVYGDLGEHEADEDHGPLVPVSTYGASKLAGEALICALRAHVRPRAGARSASATSSAAARPTASASTSCAGCSRTRRGCAILGDGTQSKSYIHVADVVARRAARAVERRRATVRASTTSRPATTSRCARSPTWRVEVVGLDPDGVDVRVQRRRPRLEGRRARRAARHGRDPRARLGARVRLARRAARARCSRCSTTVRGGRMPAVSRPAVFLDRDGVLNAAGVVDGRPYRRDGSTSCASAAGRREACARAARGRASC